MFAQRLCNVCAGFAASRRQAKDRREIDKRLTRDWQSLDKELAPFTAAFSLFHKGFAASIEVTS
jgi:hypothetical protein